SVIVNLSIATVAVANGAHYPPQPAPINDELERARRDSAAHRERPVILSIDVNDAESWRAGDENPLSLHIGDHVVIHGYGFGAGPDIDYSKIVIGNTRVLERDLPMYEGKVDVLAKLLYETPKMFDQWQKNIREWTENSISFTVPQSVLRGPLVISVQKRIGSN